MQYIDYAAHNRLVAALTEAARMAAKANFWF